MSQQLRNGSTSAECFGRIEADGRVGETVQTSGITM